MVENYQQEQTLKEPETPNYTFATIGQIYDDGMSLIFPGAEGPSEKHYKANLYCKFKAGQRVYIAKDSGTYVVLFPVGVSGSESVVSDSAKTAETAETATKASTATSANSATKSTTADKWTTARTISLSGDATGSASIDGSQNKSIEVDVRYFQERHTGNKLSFFNVTAISKKTVSNLTSTPTVNNLKTKLNDLIDALQAYGLIG